MQQGAPGSNEALQQALEAYEQMLNTFENNAKDFWELWGAPGEPMIQGVEASVQMQRAYLQLLRQASGSGSQS